MKHGNENINTEILFIIILKANPIVSVSGLEYDKFMIAPFF